VLLDENLDHALRKLLGPHEVVTVAFMGWGGLKNGELLHAAEESGIEVLVTGDQTLGYEQNLAGRRLGVVALSAIQLPIIRNSLPLILAAIGNATPGTFQLVECGAFTRKRPDGL
jgi:hypothetical protein